MRFGNITLPFCTIAYRLESAAFIFVRYTVRELVHDKVVFDATFAQNTQALLFTSKFAKYAPAIQRATSSELGEILPDGGSLAKTEAS